MKPTLTITITIGKDRYEPDLKSEATIESLSIKPAMITGLATALAKDFSEEWEEWERITKFPPNNPPPEIRICPDSEGGL